MLDSYASKRAGSDKMELTRLDIAYMFKPGSGKNQASGKTRPLIS
jgi:hypothetical protein